MTNTPQRIWAGNWLADVGETLVWDIGEWRDEPWQTVDTFEYVIKEDYDTLAAKLAKCEARLLEVEAERDHWETVAIARQARGIVIAQKLDAAEAALPAVYRLGLDDGWQGFVTDMAIRALSTEHSQDEKWLIDHAALLFQRDCDITRARKIRATQPTPTAAELMARVNEGEKE